MRYQMTEPLRRQVEQEERRKGIRPDFDRRQAKYGYRPPRYPPPRYRPHHKKRVTFLHHEETSQHESRGLKRKRKHHLPETMTMNRKKTRGGFLEDSEDDEPPQPKQPTTSFSGRRLDQAPWLSQEDKLRRFRKEDEAWKRAKRAERARRGLSPDPTYEYACYTSESEAEEDEGRSHSPDDKDQKEPIKRERSYADYHDRKNPVTQGRSRSPGYGDRKEPIKRRRSYLPSYDDRDEPVMQGRSPSPGYDDRKEPVAPKPQLTTAEKNKIAADKRKATNARKKREAEERERDEAERRRQRTAALRTMALEEAGQKAKVSTGASTSREGPDTSRQAAGGYEDDTGDGMFVDVEPRGRDEAPMSLLDVDRSFRERSAERKRADAEEKKHRKELAALARAEKARIAREAKAEEERAAAEAKEQKALRQKAEAEARLESEREKLRQRREQLAKVEARKNAAAEAERARIETERVATEKREADLALLHARLHPGLNLKSARKLNSGPAESTNAPIDNDEDVMMTGGVFDQEDDEIFGTSDAPAASSRDFGATKSNEQTSENSNNIQVAADTGRNNASTSAGTHFLTQEVESTAMGNDLVTGVDQNNTQATTILPSDSISQRMIVHPPVTANPGRDTDIDDRRRYKGNEKGEASRPKVRRPRDQDVEQQNVFGRNETQFGPLVPLVQRARSKSQVPPGNSSFTRYAPQASPSPRSAPRASAPRASAPRASAPRASAPRASAPQKTKRPAPLPYNMFNKVQSREALQEAGAAEEAAKKEQRERKSERESRRRHRRTIRGANPTWTDDQVEAVVEEKMAERAKTVALKKSREAAKNRKPQSLLQISQSYQSENRTEGVASENDGAVVDADAPATSPVVPRRKTAAESSNRAYARASQQRAYDGPVEGSSDEEEEELSDVEELVEEPEVLDEMEFESKGPLPESLGLDYDSAEDSTDIDTIRHGGHKFVNLYFVKEADVLKVKGGDASDDAGDVHGKDRLLASYASMEDASKVAENYVTTAPQKSHSMLRGADKLFTFGRITKPDGFEVEVFIDKELRLKGSLLDIVREQCRKASAPRKVFTVMKTVRTWPHGQARGDNPPIDVDPKVALTTYDKLTAVQKAHDLFLQMTQPSRDIEGAYDRWLHQLVPQVNNILQRGKEALKENPQAEIDMELDDDEDGLCLTPWINNHVKVVVSDAMGPRN